ncbi:MAG: protein-L-isoaspartate(D-aspartate) O-methyltransferase [Gammaproteobacteria bacterium]|nr:protein-L-isoaspartate(D-aspartate) O-methyltransferase [Gammaproteobacteria bacterium]
MKREFPGIGMTSRRTRERMLERLRVDGISDERVLDAMRRVPRHIFVDEALASRAYENLALPIGAGQTISQPYIVARMSEALTGGARLARVLEIGTGCGYQTAVLALLAERVFSVERIASLLKAARERLHALGLRNVRTHHGDGNEGWPEHAPYDGIIVTAAPERVPETLLDQLAEGGRMIIPVKGNGAQHLTCLTRTATGFEEQRLEPVSFVPMVSGTG